MLLPPMATRRRQRLSVRGSREKRGSERKKRQNAVRKQSVKHKQLPPQKLQKPNASIENVSVKSGREKKPKGVPMSSRRPSRNALRASLDRMFLFGFHSALWRVSFHVSN